MTEQVTINPLITAFQDGAVLAYPTEAVYGLGCDPDNEQAVMKLLSLKSRKLEKGLILVAHNYSQLLPYVNDNAIPMDKRTEIFSSWPGAITWLLPAAKSAPHWITGQSTLIAVRVSNHPTIRYLCELFGKPLVSTSANKSGSEPALSELHVKQQFLENVLLIDGELGGAANPSKIRHGLTGQTIREN
jgi:L-threonylcarbamoyladenylate synthase